MIKNIDTSDMFGDIEKRLSLVKGAFGEFFGGLKKDYSENELPEIYSYLLKSGKGGKGAKFFSSLIIEIDKLRNEKNLDDLIDFILNPEMLEDIEPQERPSVKVLSIKAISNFRNPKSVEPLLYCLNNKVEHYRCRFAAAEALGKVGDKIAVDSLIKVVSDENEKSVYVRESAAQALGMLGDVRAVDPFLGILEAKKSFLDKFTFLKERVLEALGKIHIAGDKRTSHAIWNMLYDENEAVARSAVEALYNSMGREGLEKILADESTPKHCKDEAQNILDEEDGEYEEGGGDDE